MWMNSSHYFSGLSVPWYWLFSSSFLDGNAGGFQDGSTNPSWPRKRSGKRRLYEARESQNVRLASTKPTSKGMPVQRSDVMRNPFRRDEEERKADRKQLKNLDRRLNKTEKRLTYLEKQVEVITIRQGR